MAEYIERDALLFAMDDYFHGTDPDGDEQIGVLKMMRLVRTFDAVDVAPVVHGRWIEKQEPLSWCEDDVDLFWECSVCGARACGESPYCPNCGARMDGE